MGQRAIGTLLVAVVLGAAALRPSPAAALDAETLRGELQQVFDDANALAGLSQAEIYRVEEISVTPKGEAFEVRLVGLSVMVDPEEDWRLEVGTVGFDATPLDQERMRFDNFSLPPRWPAVGAEGDVGALSLGGIEGEAVWRRSLGMVLDYDIKLSELGIESFQDDFRAAIGALTAKGSGTPKQTDGVFDLIFDLRVNGLRAESADGMRSTIQRVKVTGSADEFDVKALRQAQLEALAAARAASPEQSAEAYLEAYSNSADGGAGLPAAFEFTIGAEAFKLTAGGEGLAAFDRSSFALAFRKTGEALAAAGIDIVLDGLEAPGPSGAPDDPTVPQDGELLLHIDDIPLDLANLLAASASADPMAAAASFAGIGLRLERLSLVTAALAALGDGSFLVSPESALGITGTADFSIAGIDELEQSLIDKMSELSPEEQEAQIQTMIQLAALKGFGEKQQGSDGRSLYRFAVEVPASGGVTINGVPVMAPQ